MHERRLRDRPVEKVELTVGGRLLEERRRPRSVQVDGVDQDEADQIVQHTLLDQLFDPLVRLTRHPVVDRRPRLLPGRRIDEVDDPHARSVVEGEQIQEGLPELVALLTPQTVGDAQLDRTLLFGFLAVPRFERLVEGVHGRMECFPFEFVTKDGRHLFGGRSARTCVGHRQRYIHADG